LERIEYMRSFTFNQEMTDWLHKDIVNKLCKYGKLSELLKDYVWDSEINFWRRKDGKRRVR
jgi:hypothetical protein